MKKYIIKQWKAIGAWHPAEKIAAVLLIGYLFTGHDPLYMAGLFSIMLARIGAILDIVKKLPTKFNVGFQMQDNRLATLEQERMAWSWKTFPNGTALGALQKCADELDEVFQHLQSSGDVDREALATEYADSLMCLMDSAQRAGFSVDEILNAYAKKHEINKTRTWKSNGSGNYSHVNPTA